MERLRRLRTDRGLSQAKLAARAELDPSTVNQIERGAREASPATLRKLADALDVGIADLLETSGSGKAQRRSSPEPSLFNGLEDERLARYQHSWRDFITHRAHSIASQAEGKGYAPGWMLEVAALREEITQVLFDNGVLGKRETYLTEAEWRQSWEIFDALDELGEAVEQAWRVQMREAEKLDCLREADELRNKRDADSTNRKEALKDIREERRATA